MSKGQHALAMVAQLQEGLQSRAEAKVNAVDSIVAWLRPALLSQALVKALFGARPHQVEPVAIQRVASQLGKLSQGYSFSKC